MTALLQAEGLQLAYGEISACRDVSLHVGQGEIVTLIGANGAGKSTTLRSIIGLAAPRSGSVRLRGHDVAGLPPFRVARLGIGYVPEDRRVFPNLTVRENLEVARKTWGDRNSTAWTEDRVFELFPHLRRLRHQRAGYLSGGEQQMLTIARTLMGSPAVLLLDEPSEGLAPLVVEMLEQQLARLKEAGLTMIVTEQNVRFVSALGDRVYILENGTVRYRGTMGDFLGNEAVRRAYLAV